MFDYSWFRFLSADICCTLVLLCSCIGGDLADSSSRAVAQWRSLNIGLTDLHSQDITADPKTPEVLYASTFDGIFKSNNAGKQWQLANTGMTSNDVKVIVYNASNANHLYAGTWGKGIFLSEDAAAKWRPINNGVTDLRIRSLKIDPDNLQHIFAAAETELLESTDGGAIWNGNRPPAGNLSSLAINWERGVLHVGTDFSGIFSSRDGGATWTAVRNDLPRAPEGFYFTVAALQITSGSPVSVWAAIRGQGIYRSQDDGQSWDNLSDGVTGTHFNCMLVDEVNSDLIVVGTAQGVFMSEDGALSWQPINRGLSNLDVRALAIRHNPLVIYAATMGGGVFRYELE